MNLKHNTMVRQLVLWYRNQRDKGSYCVGKRNKITISGNRISTRFHINGNNNLLYIERLGGIKNSLIHIQGNNNKVILHKGTLLSGVELWVENNNTLIEIGECTFIGHHSHLACTEDNSSLVIGDYCMLSSYVNVRTGDSHSILDSEGRRINGAESVHIGNHCWIGEGAKILKGVTLGNDMIVGTGAIVTRSFDSKQLIGGVPAKTLKENVTWDKQRL